MGVVALRYLVLMTECHNSHKHSQGPLTTHYLTLTQLKYSLFYIFVFLQCAMVLFTLRATNTEKNYTYIIAEELIARYLTHKLFIGGGKACKAHGVVNQALMLTVIYSLTYSFHILEACYIFHQFYRFSSHATLD